MDVPHPSQLTGFRGNSETFAGPLLPFGQQALHSAMVSVMIAITVLSGPQWGRLSYVPWNGQCTWPL